MMYFKILKCWLIILHFSISAQAFPLVVAHGGGGADQPENTLEALLAALDNGADMLEISVQLTKDGVPVLYRPADLATLTQGEGPVAEHTLAQLRTLNAGWRFREESMLRGPTYPYRAHPVGMPTLAEALAAIPPAVPVILELNALPAKPLVAAVARVLGAAQAWQRVHLYACVPEPLRLFKAGYPLAQVFEERDATRNRLVELRLARTPPRPPATGAWVGFELRRRLTVTESSSLGEGYGEVEAQLWDKEAVAALRTSPAVRIIVFGVGTPEDLAAAQALGVDAVMTDSPKAMGRFRPLLAPAPAGAKDSQSPGIDEKPTFPPPVSPPRRPTYARLDLHAR